MYTTKNGVARDPNTGVVTQYTTEETKYIPSSNPLEADTIRTIKYKRPAN